MASGPERFAARAALLGFTPAIRVFDRPTRTAEEAAAAIGCDVSRIVKSLIFADEAGEAALLLVSGPNLVDVAAVRAAGGPSLRRPDAAFARSASGFAIGGVPPFGHDAPLRCRIDPDLEGGELWAAAGAPNAVFPIGWADLVRLSGGVVGPIR